MIRLCWLKKGYAVEVMGWDNDDVMSCPSFRYIINRPKNELPCLAHEGRYVLRPTVWRAS